MIQWTIALNGTNDAAPVVLHGTSDSADSAADDIVHVSRRVAVGRGLAPTAQSTVTVGDGVEAPVEGLVDPSVDIDAVRARVLAVVTRGSLAEARESAVSASRLEPSRPGPISQTLDRIDNWMRDRRVNDWRLSGASLADIATARARTSTDWPHDLTELYRRANGSNLAILPRHDLLTLERMVQIHSLWLEVEASMRARNPDYRAAYNVDALRGDPAGTPCAIFIAKFIPIADRDGTTLYVDTRGGYEHGCVGEHGSGIETPLWSSVSELFAQLASRLESNSPFDGALLSVVDGHLRWSRGT